MKKFFLLFLVGTALAGCKGNIVTLNEEKLLVKNLYIDADIAYPVFSSQNQEIALKMNSAVAKSIEIFQSDNPIPISQQMDSVMVFAKEAVQNFEDMQYQFITTYSFQNLKNIYSLSITKLEYTGGAHPNEFTVILNFDKNGNTLSNDNIVTNADDLMRVAIDKFCKENNMSKTTTQEESGLFVDLDKMPLPENIGIEKDSIVLFYNKYEIAPYYRGTTVIKLPISQIKQHLNNNFI